MPYSELFNWSQIFNKSSNFSLNYNEMNFRLQFITVYLWRKYPLWMEESERMWKCSAHIHDRNFPTPLIPRHTVEWRKAFWMTSFIVWCYWRRFSTVCLDIESNDFHLFAQCEGYFRLKSICHEKENEIRSFSAKRTGCL